MVDIGIASVCGRVIEKLRKEKGLSQKSLADRSGLHVNTIHLIENGNNEPKLSTFLFLASSLEVTPEDLMEKVTTDYDVPKRTGKVTEKKRTIASPKRTKKNTKNALNKTAKETEKNRPPSSKKEEKNASSTKPLPRGNDS